MKLFSGTVASHFLMISVRNGDLFSAVFLMTCTGNYTRLHPNIVRYLTFLSLSIKTEESTVMLVCADTAVL